MKLWGDFGGTSALALQMERHVMPSVFYHDCEENIIPFRTFHKPDKKMVVWMDSNLTNQGLFTPIRTLDRATASRLRAVAKP